ncbi:protein serine/threonine phosphatase 2C [Suhomyces tanzawaensis NRRL Y-17324]|uniref:Protein serine/threonine phosphatase 2C n=1 Tax=Suhomyces tanzawaensis NRRL Y-17324 TaxID=984487 RepID=A0A1E4SM35_9ASCO|nr:protein serine/threonine phosphatase 2C [Suhomyces tanzawaensis NRRL Y-17324]ODV80570.1 protein serine/threonine phosphatase 2C [Suhomyces tanzawaensis NRRL Y-17324]
MVLARSLVRPATVPQRVLARSISSSITFTAIDKSPSTNKPARLRVPLLKSPSHFGHFTSRVNRLYNEDKYSAHVLELSSQRPVFNFTVFDGHGGSQCSTFLADNLAQKIEDGLPFVEDAKDKHKNELITKYWKTIGGYWKRWYKHRKDNFKVMKKLNNSVKLANIALPPDDLHVRLPMVYLKTDYDFFEQEDNKSGSTCTLALIETVYSEPDHLHTDYYFNRNTISRLTLTQVGDTRALVVDKNGDAHCLTQSHHPSNPMEASRLRKYAANFFMTDSFGEERFISLANTRAFGDVGFKQMGVTSEPDVIQFIIGDHNTISKKLTPEEIKNYTVGGLGGDEAFLVLISDGVTNVITDQEVADIVTSHYNMKGGPAATPQACAEEVIKFVEYVGGDDNATCLVIRLNGWGKWPVNDRTGELRQTRMDDYNPRKLRG